ncbi:MAG: class I SAM-dependent methyltransferase [Paracoccaceae bacterium]
MTDSNAGASQQAIEFHYDMPADFFALWLGQSMTYTAARFASPGMTLDEAQRNKIDHHLGSANVTEGCRMLDVGCGWGTLLKTAVLQRGAAAAHGLTLSPLQRDHIAALSIPNVTSQLLSYEYYRPDAPFASIVSVGAFEHFVRPGSSREDRLATYAGFFQRCAEWLTKDGRLSLQTMTWGDANAQERDRIRIHDIFPESDLPEIAEVIEAAHPYLELESMENRPEDYAATLAAWADGLKSNRERAVEIVGPDRYKFYLESCKGGALLYRRRRFYLCRFAFKRRGR